LIAERQQDPLERSSTLVSDENHLCSVWTTSSALTSSARSIVVLRPLLAESCRTNVPQSPSRD
jgi:hypothetical protein